MPMAFTLTWMRQAGSASSATSEARVDVGSAHMFVMAGAVAV